LREGVEKDKAKVIEVDMDEDKKEASMVVT